MLLCSTHICILEKIYSFNVYVNDCFPLTSWRLEADTLYNAIENINNMYHKSDQTLHILYFNDESS